MTCYPLPGQPIAGTVGWFAEIFGPSGVATTGVTLQINTNDSTHVTITVDDAVQGDVVLYASYVSTNGTLVFAQPVVVVSRPPGASLTGIQLVPSEIALSVGDKLPLEVWGVYNNGARSLLFVPPDQPATYASSDTNIVGVDTQGTVTLKTNGSATMSVSFRGFAAQAVVSTLPAFVPPTPPIAVNDGGITVRRSTGSANSLVIRFHASSMARSLK